MIKNLVIFCGSVLSLMACISSGRNEVDAEKLYKKHCVLCHGADGKLGLTGAKDITASQMTLEERITNITYGAGTMNAFKDILSKEEIKAIAEYTMTLK